MESSNPICEDPHNWYDGELVGRTIFPIFGLIGDFVSVFLSHLHYGFSGRIEILGIIVTIFEKIKVVSRPYPSSFLLLLVLLRLRFAQFEKIENHHFFGKMIDMNLTDMVK